MKKIFATLIVTAAVVSSYAQGTISFQNFTAVAGRVYTNNGAVSGLANGSFTLQLLGGAPGTAIGGLTNVGSALTYATFSGGSFFFAAPITTSTPATANIALGLVGWSGGYASLAAAQAAVNANNSLIVFGGTLGSAFDNPTGGGTTAPANMVNWLAGNPLVLTLLTPTPEPATILLGGLGAASLLLFRRRK